MFDVSDESGVGRLIYFFALFGNYLYWRRIEILPKYYYFKPAGSKNYLRRSNMELNIVVACSTYEDFDV